MPIDFIEKQTDEVLYNDAPQTRVYIDEELVHYQPYRYELSSDNTAALRDVKAGETLIDDVILPVEYSGHQITSIRANGFKNRTDVVNITLPEGYVTIGSEAFSGCSKINTVTLPSSLKKVGEDAFKNTAAKAVKIPSLTSWFDMVFTDGDSNPLNGGWANFYVDNALINQVVIPEGIKTINNYALYGYKNLVDITIPEGVTRIGVSAFANTGITSVTIPSTASLSGSAFKGSSLIDVKFAEGSKITEIPGQAFQDTPITGIKLPSSVKLLQNNAFYGCKSLPFIDLPEGVKSIGYSAFYGCSALKGVVLPESLESVSANVFDGTSLERVYYKGSKSDWDRIDIVPESNGVLLNAERLYYKAKDPVFGRSNYWHYVNGVPKMWTDECNDGHHANEATCTEPSVCEVCGGVLEEALGHDLITHERKEATCTEDGWEEHVSCSRCGYSTNKVTLPAKGHTEVIDEAIEPTCTTKGKTEGKHCSVCGEVLIAQEEIPALGHDWNDWIIFKEATETEDGSKFRTCKRCGKTQYAVIYSGNSPYANLTFTLNEDNKSWTVSAAANGNYTGSLTIPAMAKYGEYSYPVTKVGKFSGTKVNPSDISMPSNIKEIEEGAFRGCSNLEWVSLGVSITTVGKSAFEGCEKLRHVLIEPESLTLGEGAFKDCNNLRYIYYKGNEDSWSKVNNYAKAGVNHAVVCYYSEKQPETSGNYWYYNRLPSYKSPALIWPDLTKFEFVRLTASDIYNQDAAFNPAYDGLYIRVTTKYKVNVNGVWTEKDDRSALLNGTVALPQMYDNHHIIGIAPSGFYRTITKKVGDTLQSVYTPQKNLTGLVIPDTYKVLGSGALAYCYKLGTLFIPKSIEYIGEGAFFGTTKYTPAKTTWDMVYKETWDGEELYYTPVWGSTTIPSKHYGRTQLYFEAPYADERWDSLWDRGMYHGTTTRHKDISRLFKVDFFGKFERIDSFDDVGMFDNISLVTQTMMRLEKEADSGDTILAPPSLQSLYLINGDSFSTTTSFDSSCYMHLAFGLDAGSRIIGATKSDGRTGFFYIKESAEGKISLAYEGRVIAQFKIDKLGALTTEYKGTTYWLGIENASKSTELGLYPAPYIGEYTEHGTIANWNCKPGAYVVSDNAIAGTDELVTTAGEINIPDTVYGSDITTIADNAFAGAVATGASIGTNVTSIGQFAFSGAKLQSIKIPLNVEEIKSGAFAGCSGIKIYCVAASKPEGWADDWCDPDAEVIWAHCDDHQENTEMIEPTCDRPGGTVHYCDNCGYSYTTDIVDPLGHTWVEGETIAPTCEAKGYTRRSCSKCGTVSGTNFVDALGHLYDAHIVKPTCTTMGFTRYSCHRSGCGNFYHDNFIDPLGHIEGEWEIIKEATATEAGSRQKRCTRCNEIIVTEAIPALGCTSGHDWGEGVVTAEPTCTENGLRIYTCKRCGETVTSHISALGHSWGAWEDVHPAICEIGGMQERTCSRCGAKETRSTPALGHDWDSEVVVVPPTCGESGYTIHTCNNCGTTRQDSFTEATGMHNWSDWNILIPPDCTVEGQQKCTCADCNAEWVASIPKTEHILGDWIIDKMPTTEEEGSMHQECIVCGVNFGAFPIPKLEETDKYILTESGEFLTDEEGNKLIIEGE